MEILLVGGAVRDLIINKEPKDKDYLVVNSSNEEMLKNGFTKVGKDFPVYLHPETKDEYALPRKERSTGDGYNDFEVVTENVSIEDDLFRRDLTINAIALNESTGEYIDPFGGINDIENRVLRHVSDAFIEDPVRIIRLARFAARFPNFEIAKETRALAKKFAHKLDFVAGERIYSEIVKALSEKEPDRFFLELESFGALGYVLPELNVLKDVPQKVKYHAEGNVFEHSLLVMNMACKLTEDPVVRFAALMHDIGKAKSYEIYEDSRAHSEKEILDPIFKSFKKRLKLSNKVSNLMYRVSILHTEMHDFDIKKKPKSIMKRLQHFLDIEKGERQEIIAALKIVNESDTKGRILVNTNHNYDWIEDDLSNIEPLGFYMSKSILFEGKDFPDHFLLGRSEPKDYDSIYTHLTNLLTKIGEIKMPKDLNKKSLVDIKRTIYNSRIDVIIDYKSKACTFD